MGDPKLYYLLLLLVALVAFNWRYIGFDRLFGGGKPCRWKKTAEARDDFPAQWRCTACGVDCGTNDGEKPTRCLRAGRTI